VHLGQPAHERRGLRIRRDVDVPQQRGLLLRPAHVERVVARDQVRARPRVVVDEEADGRLGRGDRPVPGGARPRVRLLQRGQGVRLRARLALQEGRRAVRRAVVHDDDLELGVAALGGEAPQRLGQDRAPVTGRDDHAQIHGSRAAI
jgi:hypothetical protein